METPASPGQARYFGDRTTQKYQPEEPKYFEVEEVEQNDPEQQE